jgi:hypothetical protein
MMKLFCCSQLRATPRSCAAILLSTLCLILIGCQRTYPKMSPKVAPGTIVVEVSQPKGAKVYQYRVTPSSGQVLQSTNSDLQQRQNKAPRVQMEDAGCTFEGTTKESPNQEFIARCFSDSIATPRKFMVTNRAGRLLFEWRSQTPILLGGFAWSSNSNSVALIASSEEYGRGPLDAFWSFVGHPVPYDTFSLEVIDIVSGRVSEYPIRRNVQYGSAKIIDWMQ